MDETLARQLVRELQRILPDEGGVGISVTPEVDVGALLVCLRELPDAARMAEVSQALLRFTGRSDEPDGRDSSAPEE